MRIQRLRPFTLLEVLIVIAILALISGVVALGVNKAVFEQRFQNEVAFITERLSLAQNIVVLLKKTDVKVVLQERKQKDGIECYLETDALLSPSILREVVRKQKEPLKAIKGVFFHDQLAGEVTRGRVEIRFLSGGTVMSSGIMRLASTDDENPPSNTLQSFICLAGYPHPILSFNTLEEASLCAKRDSEQERQLTEEIMAIVSRLNQ